jgi:4-hydroxy-tetrahydrodipicolinate synthase
MLTPFRADGSIDVGTLCENVARLAAAGVDGVYSTDADGEFYAIEHNEFGVLVEALGRAGREAGIPAHAGVSWSSTHGVVERLRIAVANGLNGAHVGHPTFMPMAERDLLGFWTEIGDVLPSDFDVVHYNSARMPNQLRSHQYTKITEVCPNLRATKHVGDSIVEFAALVESNSLSHLVGEHAYAPFSALGATGICSWFVNFNPHWLIAWKRECESGDWASAWRRQRHMLQFIRLKQEVFGTQTLHGVMNKAVADASDFLAGAPNRTRAPYRQVDPALVSVFRQRVEETLPEMVFTRGGAQ